MTQVVTSDDFQEKVLDADGIVMVDFWAAWCGPCVALAPILEKVGKELDGKVKVMKLNVDENNKIAHEYQIRSIPNVKIFKNGEVVKDLIGLMPKKSYIKAVEEIA